MKHWIADHWIELHADTDIQKYRVTLETIRDIGLGYDNCNTIKSLKELIDDFRDMAYYTLKNLKDR